MAIRTILHYPDPKLREKAVPVDRMTPELAKLVDEMAETMYAAPGVGLAATQIGERVRIFVVDISSDDAPSDLKVFVNPEIIRIEGSHTGPEGCLSFPGVTEDITRAERVTVRALDRRGAPFVLSAEGLLAVAIQHEHDHLEGVLMVDRMGVLKRRIVQRKMHKRNAEAEG